MAQMASEGGSSAAPDSTSAHKTLISLGIMVVVMILLVEVAGTGKSAADVSILLLLGGLLMLGINEAGRLGAFTQSYPWTP